MADRSIPYFELGDTMLGTKLEGEPPKETIEIPDEKDRWPPVFFKGNMKSGWPDSNRRHPAPKAGALPTALHPEKCGTDRIRTCDNRLKRTVA